eukprot:jgi/Phyca11/18043/fgenesh1_pg.PHYCAscaffold_32_\
MPVSKKRRMPFVDAVWQLTRQFPCSFEFSERYLIALLDEVYDKRSETFLHDCEGARTGSKTAIRCTMQVAYDLSRDLAVILSAVAGIERFTGWPKELQVTQRELQDQLSAAHKQLQSQVEQNSDLQSELEQLRRERAQLARLLEGEVYSDTLNGLLLHEEDDDEDVVVLRVTPVAESRTT